MGQLSLWLDKELGRRLEEVAQSEHLSLNKAALLLLRRGAALIESAESPAAVGDALDRFIGRLLESIASCETVDETVWK